jgi:hypothetical protein
MRALVIGAALLVTTLGAGAPTAEAQVIVPPPFPLPPVGYGGTAPGYGYYPSPGGLVGSNPPYGSEGVAQNSVCVDPTTQQQSVIPTAHVFDAIASTCTRLPPGF